ncbi:MAG: ATP-binding protein, partial [Bacteroidales bacterium]
AATESIYLINRDDVIVAANVTAAARLKRPVDQVVGRCWRELVPPQLVEERRRRLEQVLTTGRPARFEDERDGIVFDHSFFPVGQAGEPTSAVAIFSRDITEQKRAAEERERLYADAQEANRAKDQFLATLSHELRTPLHAIQGWAQMLVSGSLDAARQRQAVEAIARNASLQARLVDEVLDLSRIVSGRFHVHQATANVAVFIQRALDTIAPAAAAKDITIASSVPHDVVMAGDADRLQQVMWNLLSNAVKFTPAGGRVTVRAQVAESSIEIQVEDTGVGIAEEFRPYLFERFSQADSSRTRRHGGLGLGLAIARHIVELHGGRITATSAGEGHGAVFTLSLPLHAVSPGTALAAPRVDDAWKEAVDASSLRGVAVLAVDDDQDSRQMLETMLTAAGASVTTCSSAREAFQALSRVRPDAIVSDIGMPDEDGYTFIGKVRALSGPSGNTAAVALTAYGHANDVAHALAAGYDRHLSKPVGAASLVQAIAQAIRQRAAGAPDRPHLPGAST